MNYLSVALALGLIGSVVAQDTKPDATKDCPQHAQHMQPQSHNETVQKHGDEAMGFPHDKTTHHFRLASDGGAIEAAVNAADDKTDIQAIRSHLSHIAAMFAQGDFSAPMFIHDEVPPGVTTMKLLKQEISYGYEEEPQGGRIRIRSGNPVAVAAVHDFLRFQISEHHTGDSVEEMPSEAK